MWSKIRRLILHRTFPISTKLTILYTVILFCILLFTSLLTITGLRYVLNAQSEKEIEISITNVLRYLEAGNPIDPQLLEQNLLMPGLALRVFDEQGKLLLDSIPYQLEHRPPIKKDIEEHENRNHHSKELRPDRGEFRTERHTKEASYIQVLAKSGERSYTLQFIRVLSFQSTFLHTLTISLIVTNLLGLFIAILSGMFISRKILRPIRSISDTAKEIEINDLGKRIQASGNNDELSELTNTFNHMLDRIQTGFEQQQHFVADASHELRTPVTVISGYADMLDRWGKENRSALDEGISAIKLEAANMQNLIEKLLFLARADQGIQIMNKIPLNTEELIGEVIQETCLIAPNHQVVMEKNTSASILADASFIKQMLRIFIENSIKYTPAGGRISICSKKINQYLEITIRDTGIGIPAGEQSKIFDRFYRIDKSRSKETGGTGLGLSIAHWIAEQHGISIQIESNSGEGTAIAVQIPLLPSEK
jgi:signal transduction histidine kinase